ncbi:hypothetical protein [Citrobacter phage Ci1]|nr:hypothetical protein [Citrobacter phage Ci1]
MAYFMLPVAVILYMFQERKSPDRIVTVWTILSILTTLTIAYGLMMFL